MKLDKDILKGLKQGFGIFIFFSLIFGVYAGWHSASQIFPGIFVGNFTFEGDVNISQNLCLGGVCQNNWPIGNSGDVTSVLNGSGLIGGAWSGDIILDINSNFTQRRVNSSCSVGSSIRTINIDGSVVCEVDTDTNTNAGTICSAGQYLDGDGTCNTVIVGILNIITYSGISCSDCPCGTTIGTYFTTCNICQGEVLILSDNTLLIATSGAICLSSSGDEIFNYQVLKI